MRLPITVDDKTFYMDSEDWERVRRWREEAEVHTDKLFRYGNSR